MRKITVQLMDEEKIEYEDGEKIKYGIQYNGNFLILSEYTLTYEKIWEWIIPSHRILSILVKE